MLTKKHLVLSILCLLILTAVANAQPIANSWDDESASDDFQQAYQQDVGYPRWVATADTLFLQRSAAHPQLLLLEPRTATEMLDASNLHFSPNAGPRLSLRRETPSGWGLELNYFGIDSWHSQASFPNSAFPFGVGYLSIDDAIAVPVNSAEFVYRSRIFSGEANVRYALNDWLTPLMGFRAVDFEDRYQVTGIENAFAGPYTHLISSRNHLVGSQIGLDSRLVDRGGPFTINCVVKAGIYGNTASQSNRYADTVFNFSGSGSESHVSFLGEIGLNSAYRFNKHFALRGGYQVIWLAGVALAPNQISTTDFGAAQAGVNTAATLFCHGANAGLEFTW